MPILTDYHHFDGVHWETGSVHNFFAYRGFNAPHTGKPYSEALLLGISGGVVMGYFSFAYEGYDPQCNILTRNTFDPLNTLLARLGVVQTLEQTANPKKAADLLVDTVADGSPALVWADLWRLPYNALPADEGMWGSFPILVYGVDEAADQVFIADRARVPLTVSVETLAGARGRTKNLKHRLLTLDAPDPEKLIAAVHMGIWDCIKLFIEKPPKGSKNNFGLAAYDFWSMLLTHPKHRLSWAKVFPAGLGLYAGLTSAYNFAFLFGKGSVEDAERGMYADFLDEAALLLRLPALQDASAAFRASAAAWGDLASALLPDDAPLLAESRHLMGLRHTVFLQQGVDALEEIQSIDARLATIRQAMIDDFPLSAAEVAALCERIAQQIGSIRQAEEQAIDILQKALPSR